MIVALVLCILGMLALGFAVWNMITSGNASATVDIVLPMSLFPGLLAIVLSLIPGLARNSRSKPQESP